LRSHPDALIAAVRRRGRDGETLRLVLEGLGDGGAEDDGAAL